MILETRRNVRLESDATLARSRVRCTAHLCRATPLEGLLDRAPEALVGVGGDEPRAAHAPLPHSAEGG